tara:strand:- start:325 stop:654 length:330 start_codon:yes stop_codon:yes gene_type:complete
MKNGFFEIIFESPPAEVELSTELKCREVMKANDIKKIKAFCCDLIRNQTKIETVLSAALGRLAEQESRKMVEEKIVKAKGINKLLFLFHQFMNMKQVEKIMKASRPQNP